MFANKLLRVNCTNRNAQFANNFGYTDLRYPFNSVFVHIKLTSNVAAYYDNDVNDVTVPHVLRAAQIQPW